MTLLVTTANPRTRVWRTAVSCRELCCVICFCLVLSVCSAAEIVAAPVCGDGPDHAPTAGIAAATASLNALWQRRPHGWLVSYSLKGDVEQKPAPFRLPQSQPSKSAEPSVDVIKGLLFVTELRCRVYEINPPKAFVLQIEGRNLRFLEGADRRWSPAIPAGLLHSLAISPKSGSETEWLVRPMPGARLALPDDAILGRPPADASSPPTYRQPAR